MSSPGNTEAVFGPLICPSVKTCELPSRKDIRIIIKKVPKFRRVTPGQRVVRFDMLLFRRATREFLLWLLFSDMLSYK